MAGRRGDLKVDAIAGNRLIELNTSVSSLRTVRASLMKLGYAISKRPGSRGLLVLTDVSITPASLREEWRRAAAVLRPNVANRLGIYIARNNTFFGIPRDPGPELDRLLRETLKSE